MTSFLPTNAVILRKCPMSATFVESVFIFMQSCYCFSISENLL